MRVQPKFLGMIAAGIVFSCMLLIPAGSPAFAIPGVKPPADLQAVAVSNNQVYLVWNDVSNRETGVLIERSLSPTGGFVEITRVRRNATFYRDIGLDPETTYYYRARSASRRLGYTDYSNMTSTTTPLNTADVTPPSVPTGLAVVDSSCNQVEFSWNPSTDADTMVWGYWIYRNGFPMDSSSMTSYVDRWVTPGFTMSYTVFAIDLVGNISAESAPLGVTIPSCGTVTDYFCDQDGDGHLASSVSGSCSMSGCVPSGCSTTPGNDCNDSDPSVSPSAFENCDTNGQDDDCDGLVDECDSCINGIQDNDETDIDCGGSCPACDLGEGCVIDLDCLSGSCAGGLCVDPPANLDPQCVPLQHDGGSLDGKLNIVIVPSGFNGDMDLFRQKAEWVHGIFEQYVPFGNNVDGLNVFYVPIEQGDYCNFGCQGIDRLLCCTTSTARSLSSTCTSGGRQTVVVHNSDTYGGAGNMSADLASTSVHPSAPKVAVHELGHSAFNLADEYDYYGATSAYPNCDVAGCSKWSDMIGYNGVGCLANHCAGGSYYAAENTIMKSLNYQFEEVNQRISCCTYLQETGDIPPYCDQFSQFAASVDMYDFCQIEPASGGGAAPTTFVRDPQRVNLMKVDGEWVVESVESLRPGRYPIEQVRGQGGGRLRVEMAFADGSSRRMHFDEQTRVEFPGSEDALGGYVSVEREILTVIVERRGKPALTGIGVHRD